MVSRQRNLLYPVLQRFSPDASTVDLPLVCYHARALATLNVYQTWRVQPFKDLYPLRVFSVVPYWLLSLSVELIVERCD